VDIKDEDLTRMEETETVGTFRTLVSDGAFSKAQKHLLSEGMLDPN
jgi:hypothetical protein